jgi:hypothetical protein
VVLAHPLGVGHCGSNRRKWHLPSERLRGDNFILNIVCVYHKSLTRHFVDARIVEQGNDGEGQPKGRSCWGIDNKVDFMRGALSLPDLQEAHLLLDCQAHLQRIEDFICRVSEK